MNRWTLLGGAIASEVMGTLALRAALDHPAWYVVVVVGYVASFAFLAATLREGMSIGVAYGIWAATGVALTAAAGAIIFDDRFTLPTALGIVVVIAGVLLVEFGQHGAEAAEGEAQ